jgi:hypothetical protein
MRPGEEQEKYAGRSEERDAKGRHIKCKIGREKAQKAQEQKSSFATFAIFRGYSVWQKGRGFAAGQNDTKQAPVWAARACRAEAVSAKAGQGQSNRIKPIPRGHKTKRVYATTLK